MLSMACASFLFLRRLHAVYGHNRTVRWIFTFLYVGVTACGVPAIIGFHMKHIPGTGYCTPYKIEDYVSMIDFFPGVFDTLVFLAVSYRIMMTPGVAEGGASWGDVVSGKTLPRLTQALLHSGQKYYLSVTRSTFPETYKC